MKTLSLACAALAVIARAAEAAPLQLEDVLASVVRHHPLLEAARTSIDRAEGQVLAAEGSFDPRVRVRGADVVTGYYDNTTLDAEVSTLTPLWGITPFVGWRLGRGEFPIYDGKLPTLAQGELRAGLEIPLLRGGRIDRARGDRRKAALGRALANVEVRQRQLDVLRDAAVAYADWVAAAHRLGIREAQLGLATDRARQLEQAVARGSRAPIDVVDNARLVASREATVVGARRDLRKTSLDLSVHYRDERGAPLVPAVDERPPLTAPPPAPIEQDVDAAVRRALAQSPRLAELARRLDIAGVEVDLARNTVLPRLDIGGYAAHGLGPSEPALPDRDQLKISVGATLEVPIGMRGARGAVEVASAERRRLEAERRFAIDRITADVITALADLDAARTRAELATRGAELAEELAAAERTRFERGDSNVLTVNLREDAAADAAALAIDARADVLRAHARFRVLLGEPPVP